MAAALLTTSCATLFTGTDDEIRFDSEPQGAKVFIDGIEVCETPCTAPVERSLTDELAEIKLEGYETRLIKLDQEFNAVSVLNLGNIAFWAIDAATGALMKYDQKAYHVELDKDTRSALRSSTKIEINTKDKLVNLYVRK
jgi:hypothetical protein